MSPISIFKNKRNTEQTKSSLKLFVPNKKSKVAFTLAEVLITLGIIGVVAAMTLPTLVQNYQKKVISVRVKKAYADLTQAIKLSEVNNGPIEDWDKGTPSIENSKRYVEQYIKPYYQGLTLCSEGHDNGICGAGVSGYGANYFTNNGVLLAFVVNGNPQELYVIVDVNGKQMPNVMGKDKFYFATNQISDHYSLLPYGWFSGITKEDVKSGYDFSGDMTSCKSGPNEENADELYRHGCTALLMLNDWSFSDDYPW